MCPRPLLSPRNSHLKLLPFAEVILPAAIAAVCLCSISAQSLRASDWTSYLNGKNRAGYTSAELSTDLELAWIYKSPAKPQQAWSGPRNAPIEGHEMRHRVDFDSSMQVIIQDDLAYFGNTVDNNLYCVSTVTGKPLWRFPTDGAIRLAPTLAEGLLFVGSDDGFVYCLQPRTGELVWKMQVGPRDERLLARGEMISRWPVRTGVLVDDGIAYFGAGVFPHEQIYFVAAEAKSGKILWRNDTISQENAGRNDLSPQGYLLANDDTLFVPSGRSLPVAVSKETGEIVFQRKYSWRTDAGGVVGGTKALLGDGQVYSGGPHHFLAMDQDTGDVGESYIGGRQMVLTDDVAFLMDGEKIFCVDRDEHARASQEKQRWFLRAREVRRDPSKVAEAQQKMQEYAGVGILWQVPSEFDDALIATKNLVVAGGQDKVWLLDRDSGERVWQTTVEGNVTGLAATDSLLTVSTDLGHIYGFSSQTSVETPALWPAKPTEAFAEDSSTKFFQDAATQILTQSGQTSGFCLIVGNGEGRLAWELAQQSDLQILAVEPNEKNASAARQRFEKAGIHGTRITVVHCQLDQIPFSNYFANLIVSETQLVDGTIPASANSLSRFIKPCGGVVMLGNPSSPPSDKVAAWIDSLVQLESGESSREGNWLSYRRGQLPGAGEWSHQYGNVANTSMSDDQRVRDGLGVLWYGDPGPSSMINRHEAAGAPLSTNGRMFIQGIDSVMAYDAYNGNFLWEYENPGAIRTGVFNNRETHNLAASQETLYVAVEKNCTGLDAATGEVVAEFTTPTSPDGIPRAWAYVAYDQDQLFGTSTIRQELEQKMRRRGLTIQSQTDAIFAFDTSSEKLSWIYRGKNILHTTIAIGPERVYFIDSSITPEQRQALYKRDKGELKALTGEAAKQAEEEMKSLDVRLAVALDRRTGKKLWERPVNVTDTTNVSAGGGSLTVMYSDGYLVLCGANANGHYWKQFLSGEFEKRKLLVLDAESGDELWSKNANYMNRPAVIGDEIFAEPWAFKLATGEPKQRNHPVTKEESDWRFSRPGHHCGIITATPNMMFFRSGFIGYYDLYRDSGTKHFAGQRLGCWVNAIPGNGLVMIPEASAGCVCQFSIAATVVMEPKSESKSWGIFSAVGESTPVRHLSINFGAPGDHMDSARQEWFGYPRPSTRGRLEYEFDLKPEFVDGGGWFSRNREHSDYQNCKQDWLFASGARGLKRFEVKLLDTEQEAADYDVKMHFAGIAADELKTLGVSINDNTEASPKVEVSVVENQGNELDGTATLTSQFRAHVDDTLTIQLDYSQLDTLPQLCGVEIVQVGSQSPSAKSEASE